MDIEKLKAKKAKLEKDRDVFVKQAQAQLDQVAGAISVLDELIAEEENGGQLPNSNVSG